MQVGDVITKDNYIEASKWCNQNQKNIVRLEDGTYIISERTNIETDTGTHFITTEDTSLYISKEQYPRCRATKGW